MTDWKKYLISARRTWDYGGLIEVGPKDEKSNRIFEFGMTAECSFTLPNNFHGEDSEVRVTQGSVGFVDLETGRERCESYRLAILIGEVVETLIEKEVSVEDIVDMFDGKNPADVLKDE